MILFRTNGGKDTGLGHIMRCLSLAKVLSLKHPEEKIIFRTNGEMQNLVVENGYAFQSSEAYDARDAKAVNQQKPDIVIFDSYLANTDYLRIIKQDTLLVQFDDNNNIYTPVIADIIINGNIHALSLDYKFENKKTKLLPGPKYLIMREEYQKDIEEKQGTGILITTGGSDFLNLMPRFVNALKDTETIKKIIIGPAYTAKQIKEIEKLVKGNQTIKLIYKPKSLKEHIMDSEVVITAAGSTVYEVLRLKKIPVVYTLADNQKKIEAALVEKRIISLGDYKEIVFEETVIKERIEKAEKTRTEYSDLYDILDGKGVFRIVEDIIKQVVLKKLR